MRHKDIERYLQDVLGLTAIVKPWAGGAALPYFLHDAYEFASIELIGAPYVLMLERDKATSASKVRKHLDTLAQASGYVLMLERDKATSASKVRKHLDTLAQASGAVGIYVAAALSSYDRKRLVGQRVPFIVPGNQLYLPDLGIDLREYFRQRRETPDKGLSPATQALLISALLNPWKAEVHPAELNAGLGYTSMTLSRAVKELENAGLASVVGVGRQRWLRFEDNSQAVWRKALPLLRDPVKQSVWAMPDPGVQQQARLAGESALAHATLLAEPIHPVYAISSEQWKRAQQLGMRALPSPEPGACLWQIWRYDPNICPVAGSVDPLSLILSLRNERDERVQQALSEFEKGLS